jgi:hypothetical protein
MFSYENRMRSEKRKEKERGSERCSLCRVCLPAKRVNFLLLLLHLCVTALLILIKFKR